VVAAGSSVLVNNLPSASLPQRHPASSVQGPKSTGKSRLGGSTWSSLGVLRLLLFLGLLVAQSLRPGQRPRVGSRSAVERYVSGCRSWFTRVRAFSKGPAHRLAVGCPAPTEGAVGARVFTCLYRRVRVQTHPQIRDEWTVWLRPPSWPECIDRHRALHSDSVPASDRSAGVGRIVHGSIAWCVHPYSRMTPAGIPGDTTLHTMVRVMGRLSKRRSPIRRRCRNGLPGERGCHPVAPIAHRPSPIAHRPSPIAHRPSPIAHRPSPGARGERPSFLIGYFSDRLNGSSNG